ncbi:MAG TPA: hypothetical protein VK504_11015 [Vicinamibacterales bacterium]|nr:hypothetical protein [Vicinamibacterales bacterium]
MDDIRNFARSTLTAGIASGVTSLSVASGDGARFPTPPFNAPLWNATDYPNPSNDPDREIVRVTGISTDTFTIVRAQEGTSDANHNTGGKTYAICAPFTAKMYTDIVGVCGTKDVASIATHAFASISLPSEADAANGVIEYWVIAATPASENLSQTGRVTFAAINYDGGVNAVIATEGASNQAKMRRGDDPNGATYALDISVSGTTVTLSLITGTWEHTTATLFFSVREFNGRTVTPL